MALEQYYINRGEFRPYYHLQYYMGYKLSGASYVPIDRLLRVSSGLCCAQCGCNCSLECMDSGLLVLVCMACMACM